jgi:transposase, IS30 family
VYVEKTKKYRRLSLDEREEISRGLAGGKTISQIAISLQRHKSTVSREVHIAGMNRWKYRAGRSQRRALRYARRRRGGKYKLLANPALWRIIQKLLFNKWSPEQIAKRLREEYPHDMSMHVSAETIYTYLYVYPKGELKKELISCLRRAHKRRYRKHFRLSSSAGRPRDMVMIDERPKEVEDRLVPGHWEGDIIYGRNCKTMLGTLVERKTRFLMLVSLKSKRAEEVRKSFARKVWQLPRQLRQTLTYDQGREMNEHRLFTTETRMQVYFAHPKSPWQRGTNENTNGLLRQFFPRGTDFSKVGPREVKRVEYLMNDRPRKTLGWKKPCEAFEEVLR